MKMGVPFEGLCINIGITWFAAMMVGRGNPLYYGLFFAFHIPMMAVSNKNPNFFHELFMWFTTRARIIGGVLYTHSGKSTATSV
jgi:type IV secretory pathway VirB3-like protein